MLFHASFMLYEVMWCDAWKWYIWRENRCERTYKPVTFSSTHWVIGNEIKRYDEIKYNSRKKMGDKDELSWWIIGWKFSLFEFIGGWKVERNGSSLSCRWSKSMFIWERWTFYEFRELNQHLSTLSIQCVMFNTSYGAIVTKRARCYINIYSPRPFFIF